MTAADDVEIGSTYSVKIKANLFDVTTDLSVDAFAPLDEAQKNSMSVCNIVLDTGLTQIGGNYACHINKKTDSTATANIDIPELTAHRKLDLENIVNSGELEKNRFTNR